METNSDIGHWLSLEERKGVIEGMIVILEGQKKEDEASVENNEFSNK